MIRSSVATRVVEMVQRIVSRRGILSAAAAFLPLAALAQGQLLEQGKSLLEQLPGQKAQGKASSLSEGEIGSGLKEALKVATQRVVGRVGKTDGYNGDPAIRIPLPGPLQALQGPLKGMGAGGMLDDLQLKMNRGAEQAAPKALDIFGGALARMGIDDARGILAGPSDAATQYFKRTTTPELTSAFHPVIDHALSGVGAVGLFNALKDKASGIPFAGSEIQGFDLTDFTVGKALDGLFHYLAGEEAQIRDNPAARTTDLLRKVFG
jgi:hypothetical protein